MKPDFKSIALPTDRDAAIENYFNLSSELYYKYNLHITDDALCEEYASAFSAVYPSFEAYMSAWKEYMTGLGFKLDEKGYVNG